MERVKETELLGKLENLREEANKTEDTTRLQKEFWEVAGRIKRMAEVSDEVARRAAEVHSLLFKKRIVLGFRKGALVFSALLIFSYLFFFWIAFQPGLGGVERILLELFVEFLVLYSSFLSGRCLGGIVSGIKFEGFYRYNPVELGLKLDYYSYLKADQQKRVLLFGIPILWEHLVLLSQVVVLWMYGHFMLLIPLAFLLSNLPFSYLIHKKLRTGELHRFLREMKILREVEFEGL